MKTYSKFLLAALLAPSLVLVGCGGSGGSKSSSSSSSDSSSSVSSSSDSSSSVSSSSDSSSSDSSSSESSSSSSAASETVFMLYEDGPSTITLDEGVDNTLVPGVWADWGGGGSIVSEPGTADGEDTVWDIQFVPAANAQLTAGDMGEGYEKGLKFTNMATAELRFDLKVLSIEEGVDLEIKVDSGHPNLSFTTIDIPEEGVWTPVTVLFADLVALGEGQVVNFDHVLNPFVIEAVGGVAHVQLDDIRIVCPGDAGCDLDPVISPVSDVINENFFVFEDALNPIWSDPGIQFYQSPNSGAHTSSVVDDGSGTNDVLQLEYGSDGDWNSTFFIQTNSPKDLSAFAGGKLLFDMKIVEAGTSTGAFLIKAEGGGSGPERTITINPDGAWHPYEIDVSHLAVPDLSKVNVPISIWPVHGTQNGMVMQLDNIRWELSAE